MFPIKNAGITTKYIEATNATVARLTTLGFVQRAERAQVTFPHAGPSEYRVIDADAPLRIHSGSLVDRLGPVTCCASDIGRADPKALQVCFDNEIATSPVVCHLRAVGVRLEEPALVAEVIDRLVLGDGSISFCPTT